MYRCGGSNNAMLFSKPYDGDSPISSAVDCTLSLGTPATRLTGDYDNTINEKRSSANWSANFCWDILQSSPSQKTNRGGANAGATVTEPLMAARRCANCDTSSTPLWRNGPRGPKSLCNACGIRFKKEERRAAATVTGIGGDTTEPRHYQPMINGNPWVHHAQAGHKLTSSCYSPAAAAAAKVNEFRRMDDVDDRDSPFLSWRLNGQSLVHGFTR